MKSAPSFPRNIPAAGLLLCLLLGTAAPGQEGKESAYYQAPGTKRMAERLAQIYREQDFRTDPSKDRERAEYYRSGVKQTLDLRTKSKPDSRSPMRSQGGESAAAVGEIETLRRLIEEKGIVPRSFSSKRCDSYSPSNTCGRASRRIAC